MALTEAQREERLEHIGASDMPILLGISPYRTAYDLCLEKIYGTHDTTSPAMETGNRLERTCIEFACEQLGIAFEDCTIGAYHVHAEGLYAANLDAQIDDERAIEAKYRSSDDGFGEPGTDDIPDDILAQVAVQFLCVPTLKLIYVPVAFALPGGPGRGKIDFRLYVVKRDEELIATLKPKGESFWRDYVLTKKAPPPEYGLPSIETAKSLKRREGKEIDIPDELVGAWVDRRQERLDMEKKIKAEEDQAKANVLAAMGDAQRGVCSFGTVKVNRIEMGEKIVKAHTQTRVTFKAAKG